jgi:hypothetical protein
VFVGAGPQSDARAADAGTGAQVSQAYGQFPLSFESNQGQTDARVNFLSHGQGYTLFLTPTEAVLDMRPPPGNDPSTADEVATVQLVGGNPGAQPVGLDRLPGVSNYLIGNDPSQWRTAVPNYAQVEYQDVYPGVNLVYYGNNQQHLEYDFVVAPGANPNAIHLAFQGVQRLSLDAQGELVLHTEGGDLTVQAPVLYQEINGVRQSVSGHYLLQGNGQVGFAVGAYDPTQPLVIDPVYSLVYSTYLGGKSQDIGQAIAVDGYGNAYVTGSTESTNFPTQNPLQRKLNGGQDVFVTKLNASGTGLVYSTYLGGSASDIGLSIAVDGGGNAYLTGFTSSTDFPTQNALQATFSAGQPFYGNVAYDAFVTKLNATGSALLYSTYLGGNGTEDFYDGYVNSGIFGGIAVDGSGNAYVTGLTNSSNFPTSANAFQPAYAAIGDAFVAKLNTTLAGSASLVWSSYLGGSGFDGGHGIAVDTAGNVYVTGLTESANLPTTAGAFQSVLPEGEAAFIAKVDPNGTGLVYSTYLGGSTSWTQDFAIAVSASGDAYVTGETPGTDFPVTPGAFQTTSAANVPNAFVTVFNATGSGLVYSSYLGGSNSNGTNGTVNGGSGVAVDNAGNAYVTGWTTSTSFPTANAFQPTAGGSLDAFVAEFNPAQSGTASLVYSSYVGGGDRDQGNGIAVDSSGNAYVAGTTYSTNFPTTNGAFQPKAPSNRYPSAFVTKIDPPTVPANTSPSRQAFLASQAAPSISRAVASQSGVVAAETGDWPGVQPLLLDVPRGQASVQQPAQRPAAQGSAVPSWPVATTLAMHWVSASMDATPGGVLPLPAAGQGGPQDPGAVASGTTCNDLAGLLLRHLTAHCLGDAILDEVALSLLDMPAIG